MKFINKFLEQRARIKNKTQDTFSKIATWISVALFLLALFAFFIVNSAVAVGIVAIYAIFRIIKFIRYKIISSHR